MKKFLGYALAFGAGYTVTQGPANVKKASIFAAQSQRPTPEAPGETLSMKKHVLEHGANAMQNFAPLSHIHLHICGFHFYSGDMKRQLQAHHFCSHLTEDLCQCVIYDSDRPDAKLIGIEYIISEKLYRNLSEEEKKLWHSHGYEVKGGLLNMPGVPEIAEKEALKDLIKTYGKTIHTWQVDRGDNLPYGIPRLMMAFTKDGQIDESLLRGRDRDYSVSTSTLKKNREDIPLPEKDPMADNWERTGTAVQYEKKEIKMNSK